MDIIHGNNMPSTYSDVVLLPVALPHLPPHRPQLTTAHTSAIPSRDYRADILVAFSTSGRCSGSGMRAVVVLEEKI